MSLIKVSCGIIETEGILSIQIENTAGFGSNIVIKRKGEKEPDRIKCKDEASAKKCYDEIAKNIEDMNSQ